MSTPTTAVATLPPPHYPHLHHQQPTYAQSHQHQHHNHRPGASATYRYPQSYNSASTTTASAPQTVSSSRHAQQGSSSQSARLPPIYPHASPGYASPSHGVTHQPSAPRPPPHAQHHNSDYDYTPRQHPDEHYEYAAEMAEQPPKKRRCSRGPDWNKFYANGLPKEVIVIDDSSPEPEANTSRKITNSNSTNNHQINNYATTANASLPRQPPSKKRRRDDNGPGYHVQYVDSTTPAGASVQSDRTNSALHTTAPTSLSSDGQYLDTSLPQKRKRNTRQQAANEAKRRDTDILGTRCFTYKPPVGPPKKASDVNVRMVNDPPNHKIAKVDDDDGHYIVVPDAPLTERYQITRLLGQGTFGKVVQAHDRRKGKAVAVKIIRSVQKYRDASRIELRVLATLKANDQENRNRCIHLNDCFDYRGHICIVMDLLGQSVFDFLKGNGFVPFPNSQIRNFARQLFTSVAFLHDLNLIHTDLKPENILLYQNDYQTFTYNRRIPSSSTTINRSATQRRVLLDTEIRLIDFGSATFEEEYHSSVVSTRHYRAPEIILGLGWSFPCDIWSIGCILVEFFTGDALFQTHDNLEHLAMMEAVVGRRIDTSLVQAVNKGTGRNHGANSASKYFKRLKLDYPQADTTRGSRRFVRAMKQLDDVIPQNNTFMKNFRDLLRQIFVYDPARRITAKEALNHEWFKEMDLSDDGTEAAKIRIERLMAKQAQRGANATAQKW